LDSSIGDLFPDIQTSSSITTSNTASAASSTSADVAVRVIDGKIVLDEQSLLFDKQTPNTSTSNNKNSKTRAKHKWTKLHTDQFFIALQKYGLDFTTIAQLFPQYSRKELVLKYKREEKKNPKKIDQLLMNKLPVNESEFQDMFQIAEEQAQANADNIKESVQIKKKAKHD
jgi:transcription factor TFIIIB component B''